MIELSVLRYLCTKENYNKVRDSLDINDFCKEAHSILRTIDAYFTTVDDAPDLSVDSLSNLYFSTNRGKLEFYQGIFDSLRSTDASDYSVSELINSLKRTRLLREVSLQAYELSDGRGDYQQFLGKLDGLKQNDEIAVDPDASEFVCTDLVQIINSSRATVGLRWRASSLNQRLGSLRKGNFGFVFARPETGKTTFLSDQATFMAEQIPEDAGPGIWLNNEQVPEEVVLRWYQSALGLDQVNLLRDLEGNRRRYQELIKDKLQMRDGAAIHWKQVEKMCANHKPSFLVFDQIDKIKGFDNDREDLRLGSIYIWARELAKEYCPVIGVCQADGTAEGQRWLTMAHVANAKTSKQAEADFILGIGKVNDPGYDNLRFLHLSKNKLWGDSDTDPTLRHDRWEMVLDAQRGRFNDL